VSVFANSRLAESKTLLKIRLLIVDLNLQELFIIRASVYSDWSRLNCGSHVAAYTTQEVLLIWAIYSMSRYEVRPHTFLVHFSSLNRIRLPR